MVGYDAVVDMANRAGMNYKIQPTPAVALGSYDITPLEAAGAYTMFANQGDYIKPELPAAGALARWQGGLTSNKNEKKHVLDPRVAYLVTNLMEEVLRTGTAAGVRARYNLNVPAAGKTGTSHDGWFAGFTSELLCVVWVGFDDNKELNLEGAHSAAPIWAEFMKQRPAVPRISRCQAVRCSGWDRLHRDRSAVGLSRNAGLPRAPFGSVYCRHAAGRSLPVARRRAVCHERRRLGYPTRAKGNPGTPGGGRRAPGDRFGFGRTGAAAVCGAAGRPPGTGG